MHGELDNNLLQNALSIVAERQPNIRALFSTDSESGVPYKRFSLKFVPAIKCHGSSGGDEADMERQAQVLVEEQGSQPFDLESGSLTRLFVLNGTTLSSSSLPSYYIILTPW